MQLRNQIFAVVSYSFVAIGLILGATGIVRVGSLFIAVGTAGIALKTSNFRRVEFFLPMIIAITLFALAIALPRGR